MARLRPTPPGLLEAFRAHEQALASNDAETLDRLYAPGPATLLGDDTGLLVGHDAVRACFATANRGAQRHLVQTHVQVIDDDHALVVAVTELTRGGRGLQTQLWARDEVGRWQVTAAHLSTPPPAYDASIWRLVGDPLVPPTVGLEQEAPLSGETVAVKDVYAVAGQRIGAGNPEWLLHAAPERAHAGVVQRLLDAGAAVRGVARTDELAYSLAGQNVHYGTPPNPKAPHRLPGGSSNGSAAAVSLGHATIGLGTDTGGSIRVPAAYQGLYGIRTTHGAVDRTGVLPLAPSFDTVGWLTRSAFLLQAVGDVLLPEAPTGSATRDLVTVPALLALAEPDVAAAVRDATPADARSEDWPLGDLDVWLAAFSTWQAWEAWQAHGAWLESRLDTLGADVRGRFERARDTDATTAKAAKATVDRACDQIRDLVGDRVVVLPSASSVAPSAADAQQARDATLRLTCLAGLGGLPAVSLPLRTVRGLPAGLCLLAAPGRDRDLLAMAAEWPAAAARR
ncbi:AtzH-like domain-containing protein [Nocardioides sp. DS6]|uniref:AtzH-like domain-containing protein n=1 Tax=Nocardioides eburneus TaxID=3231482 RepID=A0ABV3SXD3_9ACTN